MSSTRNASAENPRLDILSIWLYIALVLVGLVSVYSATSDVNESFNFSLNSIAGRQLLWIGSSLLIILTIAFLNVAVVDYFAYGFYALTIILNIAVIFLGKEVSGAKSWFGFGGIGIQPSEFAKLGTALAMAKFLGTYGIKFKGRKNVLTALGIFLLPMAIILAQNDTGSALVFLAFFLVLYREGLPGYILLSAVWMGILGITAIIMIAKQIPHWWIPAVLGGISAILIYFGRKNKQFILSVVVIALISVIFTYGVLLAYGKVLKSYQRDRIELIFGLKEDKKGAGFNLEQSQIAIGAGKLTGRGYLNGTQTKMGFVPEQHTDFIFCTIGEEWGFVGITIFFALYFGLLFRLLTLAEKQSTIFGRVLGYSAACIIFIHVAVNIGMTIGLVPVIGIPLPFISFGGSSLWAFTMLLFLFLKVDEKRR